MHISNLDPGLDITNALAAFEDDQFVLLFDSASQHRERDARYTILTADPVAVTRLDDTVFGQNPLDLVREWQSSLPVIPEAGRESLPPFCGGIVGLMSYELGQSFERIPRPAIDDFKTPALLAGLFDWAIVWDHVAGTVRQYVLRLHNCKIQRQDRVAWIDARLSQGGKLNSADPCPVASVPRPFTSTPPCYQIEPSSEVYSDFTRDQYTAAVARIIEYIRAGDIFQANLSQRLSAPWSGTSMQLYASVRTNNPAPFCGFLKANDFSVISASPERFLKVDRSIRLETRPIKGTRRRPRSAIADLSAGAELSSREKDRAENGIIVAS